MLLGVLGLCLDNFLHIYVRVSMYGHTPSTPIHSLIPIHPPTQMHQQTQVLLMPLILVAEQAYDMYEADWFRHHKDRDGLVAPDAMYRPREALGRVAERADLSESSSGDEDEEEEGSMDGYSDVEAVGGSDDGGVQLSIASTSSAALPPAPPPSAPLFSLGGSSALHYLGSFISPVGFRQHRAPRASEQPLPRAAAHVALPLWYALRVKRIGELRDMFSNVTGTALTLLSTMLPFL